MKPNALEDRTVAEQAQEWIQRPPEGQDGEHTAFAAWLKRSPQHVQCYLEMLAIEREFQGVDRERQIDVDALIDQAGKNVVPLGRVAAKPSSRRTRHVSNIGPRAALVASIGVAVGIFGWYLLGRDGLQSYRTETGQQQKIKLADGSIVDLNTESRLRAHFTPRSRDVYLLAGEALFDVRHDSRRPFRVHVDGMVIRDIGTRFNVYRHPANTTVSVLEGAVEIVKERESVTPTRVTAGEEVRLSARGHLLQREKTDAARSAAWRERRLWFQSATLEEIAIEFNRYNTAPKIHVADSVLRARRFSGVFNADDPKSFVQFLYQDAGIDFDYDERGLVVRAR